MSPIPTAKDLKITMKAGISETTHRFMNQASLMGEDVYGSRAAILGHLMRINAHSFHEVCVAAKQHAPEYRPGRYVPFRPFKKADLLPLAAEVGVTDPGDQDILVGLKGPPGRGA